jgi:acyl dehydratase
VKTERVPGSRQVVAHNDAADSGNPMHDDETARRFNFKGALVPGVTVFGYLSHALLTEFGPAWLDEGAAHVRFRQPVYEGETVTIADRCEITAAGLPIVRADALNPDDAVCAVVAGTLKAMPDVVPDLPQGPLPPRRELTATRRPAERAAFANEPVLGSLRAVFEPAAADEFLDRLQEDHAVYRAGVTHPAWLLRQANLVVDRNFDLGPWIHVSSSIRNLSRVHNGETVEVRAQVQDLFERKGHEYADLDVALLLDGDPDRLAMRVLHRAIYRMAES